MWEGRAVPPVLLIGNHKMIDDWRGEQSRERTKARRPELWQSYLAAGGWDGTPIPKKPRRKKKKSVAEPQTDVQIEQTTTEDVCALPEAAAAPAPAAALPAAAAQNAEKTAQ